MPFDLSQANPRVPHQRRKGGGGGIPEIDPRQRGRQTFGEMRNARRGGGSGEELMQALGIAQKAVGDLANVSEKVHEKREDERASKGALDQATGKVDEELLQRSDGYRKAVALGRAQTEWLRHKGEADAEFEAFLEQQTDLDLNARRAAAMAFVEKRYFADFAMDPETGHVRDFGAPGAARYLAEEIGKYRPQLMTEATARIEQRFNGEALNHFAETVELTASAGQPVDLNKSLELLPPTIPQEVITKTLLDTAIATAEKLKREGKYDRAIALIDQVQGYADVREVLETAAPTGGAVPSDAPTPPPSAKIAAGIGQLRIASDKLASLVMQQESGGDPSAVSPKGAVGTMQTMPFTLTDPGFGVRPAKDNSPAERERVGKDYLKAMGRRYGGNIALQLAAYNAGPGVVDDWLNGTNRTGKNDSLTKLPDPRVRGVSEVDFWSRIPFAETKNYVRTITARAGQPIAAGPSNGVPFDDAVPANPDFALPTRAADVAERSLAPSLRILPELKGRFRTTPEQRTRLSQFREGLVGGWREAEARDRREAADGFLDSAALRLMGQGPALTHQDVLDGVTAGTIDGREGAGLLRSIEAVKDAEIARADAAQNRADADLRRQREQTAAVILNTYGVDVISGKVSPAEARRKMLGDLQHIIDPLVRAEVMSSSGAFFNNVESLRQDTPEARQLSVNFDRLERDLAQALQTRVLRVTNTENGREVSRNYSLPAAQALVKSWVDEERIRALSTIRDTGKAPDWKAVSRGIGSRFNGTFKPIVPAAPQGGK